MADVIRHPDGHDHHDHHPTKTAALDHRFMEEADDKSLAYFNGNRGTANEVVALDN